jgi:CDP-glycerol glycerophosphotransferase
MLSALRKPLAKVANAILDNETAENLLYVRTRSKLRKFAKNQPQDASLDLVTIVVPIYNVESYLEVCLLSLATQTYRNIKVIMVDDGSTDSSGTIAKSFAKEFDNFSLVTKQNNGLGAARNTGVQAIETTDWLLFTDSDDLLPRNAVSNYVAAAKADHVKLVVGNPIRLMGLKRQSRRPGLYSVDRHRTNLSEQPEFMSDVTAWNKLISWELWSNGFAFPERVLYEDMAVMTKLYLTAGTFSSVSAPSYLWRVRTGDTKSITQKRAELRNLNDRIKAIYDTIEVLGKDAKLLYEYGRVVATHDLGYYLPSVKVTDQQYFDTLQAAAKQIFKATGFNDFGSLKQQPRTLIPLLLAGDRAGLLASL